MYIFLRNLSSRILKLSMLLLDQCYYGWSIQKSPNTRTIDDKISENDVLVCIIAKSAVRTSIFTPVRKNNWATYSWSLHLYIQAMRMMVDDEIHTSRRTFKYVNKSMLFSCHQTKQIDLGKQHFVHFRFFLFFSSFHSINLSSFGRIISQHKTKS